MVQPQHILSERDRINDNVVEAVVKAALNFKPENTWTKVLESTNYYEVFFGSSCNSLKKCREEQLSRSGEARHKVIPYCDLIGIHPASY